MNKKKLWQSGSSLHPLVEEFTVGEDYIYDTHLLAYDVQASIAHAHMLASIGILTEEELAQAEKGLQEIIEKQKNGEFSIKKEQEDGHTAIEQYLTEHYGDIGKKIHTGRSRNDQSLVMTRLYMKEGLTQMEQDVSTLIGHFGEMAKKYAQVPMPGYTHMQKAMPTTVGTWLDSFAAAFTDSLTAIKATKQIIDQNPLGSASGFGIEGFSLDREKTTSHLGFAKVQENPMYCGFSRGYFELLVLQTLMQPMIIAGRFANDMLLFTTQEFNFVSLPVEFTTGSSIMPQKRNYDVFEIMRGNTKIFTGYQSQVQHIVAALGSGYQRDLQLTKKPFVEGMKLCSMTITLLSTLVPEICVHEEQLQKAMTKDLYVTNEVYEEVKKGKTFRDAYLEVKQKWQKD